MKFSKKTFISIIIILFTVIGMIPASLFEVSANSDVIYHENFSGITANSTEETLDALGWSLSERFRTNTSSLSVRDGKLHFTNTASGSTDSYITILSDEYMSGVTGEDYSIEYTVKYTKALSPKRYACLLFNYGGYDVYHTVHLRANGQGHVQSRQGGDTWPNFEAATNTAVMSLRNTNSNSLTKRLFDIDFDENAYNFLNRELTVRIAISKKNGPSVYINGKLMSECVDKSLLAKSSAHAIAFKIAKEIDGEIDDITVYKGLGESPANKTVGYTPKTENVDMKIMSMNVLFTPSGTRLTNIKNFIAKEKPDIIGLQECSVTSSLLSHLGKAENGAYKCPDTTITDSTQATNAPIFYRSDVYDLVEGKMSHGSQLLERWPGSKSKAMSWAVLRHKESGRMILAMNAHFAVYVSNYTGYSGDDAVRWRISNAKQSLEVIEQIKAIYGELPAFYTGDFNMQNHEKAHRMLLTEFTDSLLHAPGDNRFIASYNNNYKKETHVTEEKYPIDRVYITNNDWTVRSHSIRRDDVTLTLTDHYPMTVEMTLKAIPAPKSSHNSGMYSGTQYVKLSAYKNYDIYYTTDGSDPKNGQKYTAAISLNGNKTLRAIAKHNGKYSEELTVHLRDKNSPELIITEVAKDTPGTDFLECVEIVNISDHAVDLSNYKLFSMQGENYETVKNTSYDDIVNNMHLSFDAGKYILQPGQTAVIWIVFKDHYTSSNLGLVSANADKTVKYDTDKFRSVYKSQTGNEIPAGTLIVPLDRTTASYYIDGQKTNLSKSFNLGNSNSVRLILTYSYAETAENGIYEILLEHKAGTGSFAFKPDGNGKSIALGFRKNEFTYGMFKEEVHTAVKSCMSVVPSDFDSLMIKAPETTTPPPVTTVPVTTPEPPPVTTPEPTTTPEPVTTTEPAPETPKEPETTVTPTEPQTPETTVSPSTEESATVPGSDTASTSTTEIETPSANSTETPPETKETEALTTKDNTTKENTTKVTEKETESETVETTAASAESETETTSPESVQKLPVKKTSPLNVVLIILACVITAACAIVGIILLIKHKNTPEE